MLIDTAPWRPVNASAWNSLENGNLISDFDAAQLSIKLLLALTFRTSHIQPDVNHIVVARHVRSPIDSELVDDRSFTGLSVAASEEEKIYFKVRPMKIETYTSTSTGYCASRNSSRQLGGKRICTAARVPCVSGTSKVRCDGKAKSSSFFENCFRVSYNTLISRWVFAECTPVRRRKMERWWWLKVILITCTPTPWKALPEKKLESASNGKEENVPVASARGKFLLANSPAKGKPGPRHSSM